MRSKWWLIKECCACHLQVGAGIKPGMVVAWNSSWWLLRITPEITGLGPALWRQSKMSITSQSSPPMWRSSSQPQPWDVSNLQWRDHPHPCTTVRFFLALFFPKKKFAFFSYPCFLNEETSWQAKPMPEEALRASWWVMLPLQTEVSTPAAQATRSQAQLWDHLQREHEFLMSGSGR